MSSKNVSTIRQNPDLSLPIWRDDTHGEYTRVANRMASRVEIARKRDREFRTLDIDDGSGVWQPLAIDPWERCFRDHRIPDDASPVLYKSPDDTTLGLRIVVDPDPSSYINNFANEQDGERPKVPVPYLDEETEDKAENYSTWFVGVKKDPKTGKKTLTYHADTDDLWIVTTSDTKANGGKPKIMEEIYYDDQKFEMTEVPGDELGGRRQSSIRQEPGEHSFGWVHDRKRFAVGQKADIVLVNPKAFKGKTTQDDEAVAVYSVRHDMHVVMGEYWGRFHILPQDLAGLQDPILDASPGTQLLKVLFAWDTGKKNQLTGLPYESAQIVGFTRIKLGLDDLTPPPGGGDFTPQPGAGGGGPTTPERELTGPGKGRDREDLPDPQARDLVAGLPCCESEQWPEIDPRTGDPPVEEEDKPVEEEEKRIDKDPDSDRTPEEQKEREDRIRRRRGGKAKANTARSGRYGSSQGTLSTFKAVKAEMPVSFDLEVVGHIPEELIEAPVAVCKLDLLMPNEVGGPNDFKAWAKIATAKINALGAYVDGAFIGAKYDHLMGNLAIVSTTHPDMSAPTNIISQYVIDETYADFCKPVLTVEGRLHTRDSGKRLRVSAKYKDRPRDGWDRKNNPLGYRHNLLGIHHIRQSADRWRGAIEDDRHCLVISSTAFSRSGVTYNGDYIRVADEDQDDTDNCPGLPLFRVTRTGAVIAAGNITAPNVLWELTNSDADIWTASDKPIRIRESQWFNFYDTDGTTHKTRMGYGVGNRFNITSLDTVTIKGGDADLSGGGRAAAESAVELQATSVTITAGTGGLATLAVSSGKSIQCETDHIDLASDLFYFNEDLDVTITWPTNTKEAATRDILIQGDSAWTSASTNQDGGHITLQPGDKASGGGTRGSLFFRAGSGDIRATINDDGLEVDGGKLLPKTDIEIPVSVTSNRTWGFADKTSDQQARELTIQAQTAFQSVAGLTNPNGGHLNLNAGDGNVNDTSAAEGGSVYITPGKGDSGGGGDPGAVYINDPDSIDTLSLSHDGSRGLITASHKLYLSGSGIVQIDFQKLMFKASYSSITEDLSTGYMALWVDTDTDEVVATWNDAGTHKSVVLGTFS